MDNDVYLSLCAKRGCFGAAIYHTETRSVSIFKDVLDDEFCLLKRLIYDVEPTVIISSKSNNEPFQAQLMNLCCREESDSDPEETSSQMSEGVAYDVASGFGESAGAVPVLNDAEKAKRMRLMAPEERSRNTPPPPPPVKLDPEDREKAIDALLVMLHGSLFDTDNAHKMIHELFLRAERQQQPSKKPIDAAQVKLSTKLRFDFNSECSTRAFGGLLCYLEERRVGVEFDDVNVKTPIDAIQDVALDHCVAVDDVTMQCLDIVKSNNAFFVDRLLCGRRMKGYPSLFDLCNQCRSVSGRKMLKRWFSCPTNDRTVLAQRHEAINYFIQDCNGQAIQYIRSRLKNVHEARPIFRRIASGEVSTRDWYHLLVTAEKLVELSQYLNQTGIHLDIIKEYLQDVTQVYRLAFFLYTLMDIDESEKEDRFVIKEGHDANLDALKKRYKELPPLLTSIVAEEAKLFDLEECSVAYLPIVGYLLLVSDTDIVLENAECIYSVENAKYYKTDRMRHLDHTIGDIRMHIIDIEKSIVLRIGAVVLQREADVYKAERGAAILDCVISLADIAHACNWIRPTFVNDSRIQIVEARHPLGEHTDGLQFVPNDIVSGGKSSRVKIINGPNASGKSLYLKTVGAVAYLAHVGSFVPAKKAVIGIVDKIVVRLYTLENVMNGLSCFATDVKQLASAVRKCDQRSLIVLDEFGKGTMIEVGMSLFVASLNYCLSKKEDCPYVFASSHFHALKNHLMKSSLLSLYKMKTLQHDNGDLQFEYKLIEGDVEHSFANFIAMKAEIPDEVVQRSEMIVKHLRTNLTVAGVGRQKTLVQIEEEEAEADKMEQLIDRFMNADFLREGRAFIDLIGEVLHVKEDDDVVRSTQDNFFDEADHVGSIGGGESGFKAQGNSQQHQKDDNRPSTSGMVSFSAQKTLSGSNRIKKGQKNDSSILRSGGSRVEDPYSPEL